MKLHFEPNLDYQHAAIESVCGLFRGQETCRTEFTVAQDALGVTFYLRSPYKGRGSSKQVWACLRG